MPTLLRALLGPAFNMANSGGRLTRIPADLLIDPDSRVALSYYGKDIGDHVPLKVLDRYANSRNHYQTEKVTSLAK